MTISALYDFALCVESEYVGQIHSQKTALLKRLGKATQAIRKAALLLGNEDLSRGSAAVGDDITELWPLVDNISHRSHQLYGKGCALLVDCSEALDQSLLATSTACSVFATEVLDNLLTDIVAYDTMMGHWRSSVNSYHTGGALIDEDCMRLYSHSIVVMPSLTTGKNLEKAITVLKGLRPEK